MTSLVFTELVYAIAIVLAICAFLVLLTVVAVTAHRLSRSVGGWIVIGIPLSPVIAGMILLLLKLPARANNELHRTNTMTAFDLTHTSQRNLDTLIRERIPPR